MSLRFSFRRSLAPGLLELLQAQEADWKPSFPAQIERPTYESPYVTLTLNRSRPQMGNAAQSAELLADIARMTGALRPMIDDYFATSASLPASE
jgi:hypothetical protein